MTKEEILALRNEPWRDELRKKMSPKDRGALERVKMPELTPDYRVKTFTEEVQQGLTKEMAVAEAQRCLDCADPSCMKGCPVGINIPTFVKQIENEDFEGAIATIKLTSSLPAVCGRVCPQEKQCEGSCIKLKMKQKPVAIGYLERFAADYERESGKMKAPKCAPKNGKKVCTVGSGPSALAFAADMIKLGYDVTVFEALHEIGGVLKYGIPEFRLPNSVVDAEIDTLRKMGVNFQPNTIIGKTISYEQLHEMGFDGIFVGSGAGLPRFMNIPGENLIGVMSSNEYLTRINLMGAGRGQGFDTPVLKGKNVVVCGGGNTAMDSARTAKRMGAETVTLVYRRGLDELPARAEEVHHAMEEGIDFHVLHNPLEYHGDENGRVKEAVLQVMELGEPDASGRRSPVPVEGKTETIPADLVVVAIGVSPNPIIPTNFKGLEISKKGTIVVGEETMQSAVSDVFAGGDIVRGGATVILAMGDGRKAAANMDEYLKK
ncbi:MAG: NADPH-dependent glutamate synthase [Salinivirgaceae bacterium]|nr:NADPH-dependent glutamate synthase [Salinivirgaceae bacterium]